MATVLVVAFTLSTATLVGSFLKNSTIKETSSIENSFSSQVDCSKANLRIINIDTTTNVISFLVNNVGLVNLTNIKYLAEVGSDQYIGDCNISLIQPGEFQKCSILLNESGTLEKLRVVSTNCPANYVEKLPNQETMTDVVLYLDGTYDEVNGYFIDKSGNGNHGTPYNGDTTGTGVVGDGMSFDGVDDYIGYGSSDFQFDSTPFSCAMWYKNNDVFQYRGGLIGNADFKVGGWCIAWNNSGGQICGLMNELGTEYIVDANNITILEDTWYFIVMNYDGINLSLSVDTVLDGYYHDTLIADINNTTKPFKIGVGTQGGWETYQNCELDEIRIYDRALTAEEIQTIYNLENPN